jgi:hypothetical protein
MHHTRSGKKVEKAGARCLPAARCRGQGNHRPESLAALAELAVYGE